MENHKRKERGVLLILIITMFTVSLYLIHFFPACRGLLRLFYYTIISNVYISIFPHEPVLIYYGKICNLIYVSVVAGVASVFAGIIDYETISPVLHHKKIRKYYANKNLYVKSVYYFSKYPFLTIFTAAFTPIPFYPFKFLSIASLYPKVNYLLALFIGRVPRYLYLTSAGKYFSIPDWVLIVLFILMFLIGFMQYLRRKYSQKRDEHILTEPKITKKTLSEQLKMFDAIIRNRK